MRDPLEGRDVPRLGLALLLTVAWIAPGAADLTLKGVTLGGAIEQITQGASLEYVLCGDTDVVPEVALQGSTPAELMQAAVDHFPCRAARLGDLFLIDAQPAAPGVLDTIWAYFDETSTVGPLPNPPPDNPRGPLGADLWELWDAKYKACFPAPPGVLRFAPFATDPADELGARLCRDSYVEIAISTAGSVAATAPDDAWLTLEPLAEGVYTAQLNWRTGTGLQSVALGGLLQRARMESSPGPSSLGRWIEAYLTPGVLRVAAPRGVPTMAEAVSVRGRMSLTEAASQVAQGGPAARVAEDVGALDLRANLVDRPRWAALTLLSVASGVPWGPRDLAAQYSLRRRPRSLTDRLWAAMSPVERLAWEVAHAPATPCIGELLWAVLEPAEREALQAGERVPVAAVTARPVAAAVYDLVIGWQFRQPSRDAAVAVAETDRIWDRLGGACGTFTIDDVTTRASRYEASGARRHWLRPALEHGGEAQPPACNVDGDPWYPDGHPPTHERPFGGVVRDGGSGGPRSREYEEPRPLGEAPEKPTAAPR